MKKVSSQGGLTVGERERGGLYERERKSLLMFFIYILQQNQREKQTEIFVKQ